MRSILLLSATMIFIISCGEKSNKSLTDIKIGDSVFVKNLNLYSKYNIYRIADRRNYKEEWEKKKLKADSVNRVIYECDPISEKDLFQKSSSFIGVCDGYDTVRYLKKNVLALRVKPNRKFKFSKDPELYLQVDYYNIDKDHIYVLEELSTKINTDSIYK